MTKEERKEISEWEKFEIRKWCVEKVITPILAQLSHSDLDREVEAEEILEVARKIEQYIMKG